MSSKIVLSVKMYQNLYQVESTLKVTKVQTHKNKHTIFYK